MRRPRTTIIVPLSEKPIIESVPYIKGNLADVTDLSSLLDPVYFSSRRFFHNPLVFTQL